jgi:hypothetical protein
VEQHSPAQRSRWWIHIQHFSNEEVISPVLSSEHSLAHASNQASSSVGGKVTGVPILQQKS